MSKRFSRRDADRAIRKIDAGYIFPLPDTTKLVLGLPDDAELPEGEEVLDARVKKLSIAKLALMTGLSPTMQNAVLEVFEQLDKFSAIASGEEPEEEEESNPWQELVDGVRSQVELRDGACIAGFIDPPLTETREEAEADPTGRSVWVGSLADTDKARYLSTVMSPEGEAAKALEPFPEDGLEGPSTDPGMPTPEAPKRRPAAKRGGGPK